MTFSSHISFFIFMLWMKFITNNRENTMYGQWHDQGRLLDYEDAQDRSELNGL